MMAVIRVEKNANYTTMCNQHLKDKNLSLKAKGLLSMMLSLPDEWHYSVKGLKGICKESVNTINGILGELEENQYLIRRRKYYEGKISEWEYIIFETKDEYQSYILHLKNEDIEEQDINNLHLRNEDIENEDVYKNNKELNIKELNTEKTNTKQKKRAKAHSKKSESFDEILNSLNNKDLEDAFKEFINMRKEIKKPLTPYALKLAIKELFKLSDDSEEMIAIVNQSIANSWQGLFPLKQKQKYQQSNKDFYTLGNGVQTSNPFVALLDEM